MSKLIEIMPTDNPEVFEITNRIGCGPVAAFILGFPTIVLGGYTMSLPVLSWGDVPFYMDLMVVIAGLGLFWLGWYVAFKREGFTLDKQARSVRHWKKVIIPYRSEIHLIDGYDAITLGKRYRRDRKSSVYFFPVYLRSKGDARDLVFGDVPHYDQASRVAEQLAQIIELPFDQPPDPDKAGWEPLGKS